MGKIQITRQQELELPKAVTVKFINKTADYLRGSQTYERQTGYSVQRLSFEAAVVFDDTTARTIATKLSYNAWIERDKFFFYLPRRYMYLEPTDVIVLVDKDTLQRYYVRITKKVDSRSGVSECEGVAEFAPLYTQLTVTNDAQVSDQILRDGSVTLQIPLDIPALHSSDTTLTAYIALAGASAEWTGAELYLSSDGGATFQPTGQNTTTPTTMGVTKTVLNAWNGTTNPDTNTVQVTLTAGTLQSIAPSTLATGANTVGIKGPLGWEILQFTTATPTGDKTYTLSGLVRGEFGTTAQAFSNAPSGASFVLLSSDGIIQLNYTVDQIGDTIQYKIVPIGKDPATVAVQSITLEGEYLRPYPPLLQAVGADTDGNVTIAWESVPRPGETDPYSNDHFDVEFYWDGSYTSIVKTVTTDSGVLSYPAAEIAADYGAPQSVLYFQIFEISPIDSVGRGSGTRGMVIVNPFSSVYNASIQERATASHLQVAQVTTASGGVGGGGTGGTDTGSTTTVSYTASTVDFPNPERGFAQQTGNAQLSQYYGPDVASKRINSNVTVYWMLVYLNAYTTSAIPSSVLNNIQANFDALRAGGAKAWLRFEYEQNDSGADATKAQMKAHIDQLKPYLQANNDVIAVMDAGFIGSWGEWAHSNNFGGYGTFSTQNWADRKELLEYLLDALPSNRSVMLRVPYYKQHFYGNTAMTSADAFSGSYISRIGHHHDAFLSGGSEQGTYGWQNSIAYDKAYVAQECQYTPRGGESDHYDTAALSNTACPAALSDLSTQHWSLLNNGYHASVLQQWKDGGCYNDISKNLGYRFVLTSGTYPTIGVRGGSMPISITLNNVGYASPFNQRTAKLVLKNNATGAVATVSLSSDPRTWLPGSRTINETLTIPSGIAAGTYSLYLWLPDSASSLANNPAYAIQLANIGVWQSSTGYNSLNHNITIS